MIFTTRIQFWAKIAKIVDWLKKTFTPAVNFREFAAKRLVQSVNTQKQNCRAVSGLSNGIHFNIFKK